MAKIILLLFAFIPCLLFAGSPEEIDSRRENSLSLLPDEIISSYFPESKDYLIPDNKKVSSIIRRAKDFEENGNFKNASSHYLIAYSRIKDSLQAPYIKFKQCGFTKSIDESTNGLKEIIKDYPSFPLANAVRFQLAECYYISKEYKASLRCLNDIEADEIDTVKIFTPYAYIFSGLISFKAKNYDDAIDYYKISLKGLSLTSFSEKNSFVSKCYLGISKSFIELDKYSEAEDLLLKIYGTFSSNLIKESALYLLSNCYLKSGRYSNSYSAYNKIIEDYPSSPYSLMAQRELEKLIKEKGEFDKNDISGVYEADILECSYLIDMTKSERLIIKNSHDSHSIQVGSFAKKANALNLVDKLTKMGYSSYYLEIDLEKNKVYRVRVGHFPSRADAEKIKKILAENGYNGFIVNEG